MWNREDKNDCLYRDITVERRFRPNQKITIEGDIREAPENYGEAEVYGQRQTQGLFW